MITICRKFLKKTFIFFSAFLFFYCFSFLPGSSSFAAGVAYQYDSLNRLTKVQYSSGRSIAYTYDPAGNTLSISVSLGPECTECANSPVNLTNVTFSSGTVCECRDGNSITIGTGVTIKSGANITFKAPIVKIQSGFNAEQGAMVNIKQQ